MRRIMMICLFFLSLGCLAQQKALNIPGLYQLVDASKSENKLQDQAKNQQLLISSQEYENKTLLAKLKNKYRDIQQRYQTLGTLVLAANIGINATPMINHIIQNQSAIYQIASAHPVYVLLAYQTEIEFATRARSLLNYLMGLTASLGTVNQMKIADRKILFDFVLTELNTIESLSSNLLTSLDFTVANGLLRTLNPYQGFIDQDKDIVNDIIHNAKYLKQ